MQKQSILTIQWEKYVTFNGVAALIIGGKSTDSPISNHQLYSKKAGVVNT